ncbi:hypothetical protein [Haliangium ochraceum]|uniref:Co-chaperone DjlA N-terminal domain-containing protein n=1 Tax=Haliangium ochraceum (strain DSM 14365 / JCM 11303 / SMP-2) TaxID=502025 RepID=D0LXL4_HALO1|nr:hypothetical protein [Haliangium ochraceum]ACY17769.1 conserved hypothetical protein [Haliangium ochraceum DSM 14365]
MSEQGQDKRLHLELIKLLLQVAWADDRVEDFERAHLRAMAQEGGLDAEQSAALEACLDGHAPLPAPDLGFLRAHRDAALAAAQQLMVGDHEVARGELIVFDELRTLLGG